MSFIKSDNNITISAPRNSILFSAMFNEKIRELRLDEIFYSPSNNSVYWKCFCFSRKQVRNFKHENLNTPFTVDKKEFSKEDFFKIFLKIDYSDFLTTVSELKRDNSLDRTRNKHRFIQNYSNEKIAVITGTLENYTRAQAKALLEEKGYKVSNTVSHLTSFLIAGEKAGSKLSKAQELGVKILSEQEFIQLTSG